MKILPSENLLRQPENEKRKYGKTTKNNSTFHREENILTSLLLVLYTTKKNVENYNRDGPINFFIQRFFCYFHIAFYFLILTSHDW